MIVLYTVFAILNLLPSGKCWKMTLSRSQSIYVHKTSTSSCTICLYFHCDEKALWKRYSFHIYFIKLIHRVVIWHLYWNNLFIKFSSVAIYTTNKRIINHIFLCEWRSQHLEQVENIDWDITAICHEPNLRNTVKGANYNIFVSFMELTCAKLRRISQRNVSVVEHS